MRIFDRLARLKILVSKLRVLPREVQALNASLDALTERVRSLEQHLGTISKSRWIQAEPNAALTWGAPVSGDAFIAKAAQYLNFSDRKSILEIGPGYGRILRSLLDACIPFREYQGIDLSHSNYAYLVENYSQKNVHFIVGDAESVRLEIPPDIVLSSLTFKHLFPSFEQLLSNIVRQTAPGTVFVFDLLEGSQAYFEQDGANFLRSYSREEITAILERVDLRVITFDSVSHDPEHVRLLVVAAK